MAYDYTYTDRYVHYAAAGGGDGSLGSPWTFAEAIAAVTNGMRINVEEGVYYLSPAVSGGYIEWCPAAQAGSSTAPMLWRGWKSATSEPGVASFLPGVNWTVNSYLLFKASSPGGASAGQYNWCAQNFDIRLPNSSTLGMLSGGTSSQGKVVFVNCYLENTHAGTANYAYITNTLYGFFIGCHLKNNNVTAAAANSYAFPSTANNSFVGCYIEPYYSMQSAVPTSQVFHHNIVKTQNGAVHTDPSCCFKNGTDLAVLNNNVFVDFGVGVYVGSVSLMRITLLNNLFHNVAYPIKYQSSGTATELLLYGNYCYGADQSFPESLFGPMQKWGDDYPGIVPLDEDPFRGNGDWRLVNSPPVNGAVPKYLYKETFDPTTDGLISLDSGALQVEPEIDYPSTTDVREGVQYANGFFTGDVRLPSEDDVRDNEVYDSPDVLKEKTGTLIVPAASDVKLDVPVDNTVGTYDARRDITFKDSSSVS